MYLIIGMSIFQIISTQKNHILDIYKHNKQMYLHISDDRYSVLHDYVLHNHIHGDDRTNISSYSIMKGGGCADPDNIDGTCGGKSYE